MVDFDFRNDRSLLRGLYKCIYVEYAEGVKGEELGSHKILRLALRPYLRRLYQGLAAGA